MAPLRLPYKRLKSSPLHGFLPRMAFWSCIRAEPSRDKLAVLTVQQAGFVTFAPKIRVVFRREPVPLFNGYFFARIEAQWRAIERSPGVSHIIKFQADAPARIPDSEIEALRARTGEDGVVRLAAAQSKRRHAFAAGEKVDIVLGPFRGLAAVHSGMSAAQREIVLLEILGATRRVAIATDFVAPVMPA